MCLEDVRLNRSKRFGVAFTGTGSLAAPTPLFARRANRTAVIVSCATAGVSVEMPGGTVPANWTVLWTSTASQLTKEFTLEVYGDLITNEFYVGENTPSNNVWGTEVYLDAQ